MEQEIFTHVFDNGFTLLAERMTHVRSAAFGISIPCGAVDDPAEKLGLSTISLDLATRGAGTRGNRELSDAFDQLGVDRSESANKEYHSFACSLLGRNLFPAMELYADMIQRPHLPADDLDASKAISLQEIAGLEDEPMGKVMSELSKAYYPDPLSRDSNGTVAGIENITHVDVQNFITRHYHARGVVLAVAGDFEWNALLDRVGQLFGTWRTDVRQPRNYPDFTPTSRHVQKELDQTQIAFAFPAVAMNHPDALAARMATAVLSMDMSSRLFMNVREKYGLCYSVQAFYQGKRYRGDIIGMAAARPDKAQETLDRTLAEIHNLSQGIDAEELDRVKIGVKSALIMSQESTASRASSLSSDWRIYDRIRLLEEIRNEVEAMTIEQVLEYVRSHPTAPISLATLGPAPLQLTV
ncbi:MAG: pitrilysin family protein [Zavarzinella sp.]